MTDAAEHPRRRRMSAEAKGHAWLVRLRLACPRMAEAVDRRDLSKAEGERFEAHLRDLLARGDSTGYAAAIANAGRRPSELEPLGRLRAQCMYARQQLAWYARSQAPEHAAMAKELAPVFKLLDEVGPLAILTTEEADYIHRQLDEFQLLIRRADMRAIEEKHRTQRRKGGIARAAQRKNDSKAAAIIALYREKQLANAPQHEIAGDVAHAFDVSPQYVNRLIAKNRT